MGLPEEDEWSDEWDDEAYDLQDLQAISPSIHPSIRPSFHPSIHIHGVRAAQYPARAQCTCTACTLHLH